MNCAFLAGTSRGAKELWLQSVESDPREILAAAPNRWRSEDAPTISVDC